MTDTRVPLSLYQVSEQTHSIICITGTNFSQLLLTHSQQASLTRASRCNTQIAIVLVFEQACGNTKSVHRSCVWDKTLTTLLTTLDRDLLRQATLNVTETIQDIHTWNTVIRSKRTPNPGVLARIDRRHELDTLRDLISKEVENQRPDVMVVDVSSRRIFVIEVARTEDSTDKLRRGSMNIYDVGNSRHSVSLILSKII